MLVLSITLVVQQDVDKSLLRRPDRRALPRQAAFWDSQAQHALIEVDKVARQVLQAFGLPRLRVGWLLDVGVSSCMLLRVVDLPYEGKVVVVVKSSLFLEVLVVFLHA